MRLKSIKSIYFSPTRTTEKTLKGIAEGIHESKVEQIDLTLQESGAIQLEGIHDELVILGAPVYGGRIPIDAVKRFKRINAKNSPAVVVVLYGNRAFEDALLELANIAEEAGFKVVAGGAFIGEHSYSNDRTLIAEDRPDKKDIEQARKFGKKILDKMEGISSVDEVSPLHLPGNFPYKERSNQPKVTPAMNDSLCSMCGECALVCPTSAITIEDTVTTDLNLCIRCSVCVKICPEDARAWEDEKIREAADWLSKNCSMRKEPEIFI